MHYSLQQWKDKVKIWGLKKNISVKDVQYFVAKAEKRRQDWKETTFWHAGSRVNPDCMEKFKKRKIRNESEATASRTSEWLRRLL